MDELTREFLIESQEGLDRMERCLTDLEKRPDDTGLLAEVFRSVHTIKGTTGFLGFKRLEKMAHAGENLLGMLRDGRLTASAETITGLLRLLDGLRGIFEKMFETGCMRAFITFSRRSAVTISKRRDSMVIFGSLAVACNT